MAGELPPLPAGFSLDSQGDSQLPPLPADFRLDQADTQSVPQQSPATLKNRATAVSGGFNRGLAAIAGVPVDAMANVWDLIKAGIGATYGSITGKVPPAALDPTDRANAVGSSEYLTNLMDRSRFTTTQMDRPDDRASRYLYAAGSALPAVATLRPTSVPQALNQGAQMAALSTVPEAVADMGGGAGAQGAAAMGASMMLPAALATVRASRAAVQPLSTSGQRQIAGAAIRNAASNPARAAQNMESATPMVPGSSPTAGQAARDPGIANFENRLRALDPAQFSGRMSQQNEARQRLLDTVAKGGQPEAITAMEARREGITTTLRDKAMQEAAGKRVPTEKIIRDIDALIANPENAGQSVQQALRAVRSQIAGKPVSTGTSEGYSVSGSSPMTDARALYAVRKEINRVLEGKHVNSDESVMRYAGGQLASVRRSLDDAISEVAPSWKDYLTKYAQLSKPIDRAQEIGSIRQRTSLAAPDIETGRDFLSQPKWRNVVGKNMAELSTLLTKGQAQKMQMIAADLDRGAAAANSASIRVPGSDTAANLVARGNLSVANIVGRTLGKSTKELPPALANLTRPMSWLYSLPDAQVQKIIVDGLLDPKLGAQLMREGTLENVQALSDSFRRSAEKAGILIATDMTDARQRLGAE